MKFEEVMKELREKQEETNKAHQEWQNKNAELNALIKSKLGIAPGEPTDILSLATTIKLVSAME